MITYDKKSWKIHNERIFILSAAIHYFRLPRAEWDDVLEKAKAGGCNTIETYIPWNFHEMKEGEWDFSGDKDLAHFLQLCADKGLYVIARPGPYICAEWDFGGFPWWLSTKKDIQYRSAQPSFLHYVDQYFDQVISIIDKYQLTKNGSVIMVQIENEFQAYGKPDKKYMEYLRDGMIARGIEVPFVTCYGAVDGAVEFRNFWSSANRAAESLDERFADQPKGVMEFWIGWFEHWGGNKANQKTPQQLERECYQLLSNGFTTINYYMYFGGTNFDHWGGRTVSEQVFCTTTYDYDVAIDEYLQPTRKYEVLKRYHSFVKWLEPLFTNAEQAASDVKLSSDLKSERIVSPHGEVLFIENNRNERIQSHVRHGNELVPFTIEANAVLPIVRNVKVGNSFTIKTLTGQTTGFNSRHAVIYHENGQRSTLVVQLDQKAEIHCPTPNRFEELEDGSIAFHLFHGSQSQTIKLLFKDGSSYSIEVVTRTSLDVIVPKLEKDTALNKLSWKTADEPLSFLTGKVKEAEKPLDFSSFGQFSGYLGYESEFDTEETQTTTVVFPRIEDPVMVFCNQQFVGKLSKIGAAEIEVPVKKGKNTLTCLVQNMGRFNYSQVVGEPKGISEPPALNGKYLSLRGEWQVEGCGVQHHLSQIPRIEERIAFLRSFENEVYDRAFLVGEGVSRVTVNGEKGKILMECQTGWSRNSAVYGVADISDALKQGENVLDLDVQNITSIRRFDLYLFNEKEQISGWKTKAFAQQHEVREWKIVNNSDQQTINPRWHKSSFTWNPDNGSIVKVRLNQLSKGCFWVNGQCLGRYWNIGPQEDYKIPASLLKEQNEIVIFDEEGFAPDHVVIHSYSPFVQSEKKQLVTVEAGSEK
ncbi:beta-galactosidase [Bacillus cereus]|uniref:Beta-galactosidase n=1 Tax=Bacillus cereus TaxID=1396 RepID=A0A2A8LVQ6_BACCE|nr:MULTISPECIES: beta-galactosidase [Bacillus cereus group]MEA1011115.1 beta-galactosidase [Bacillus cereus]PES97963.1 beta-galactosidase [Bacillus cereus]PFP74326.1 beta-galactosidase [Bacillus cereus]